MAIWKTHKVDTAWHGGGGRDELDCEHISATKRNELMAYGDRMIEKPNGQESDELACIRACNPGLANCMRDKWKNSVQITCSDCTGLPSTAQMSVDSLGGTVIIICNRVWGEWDPRAMASMLFHELIHLCGGQEVDAYVLTMKCRAGKFPLPTMGDEAWDRMRAGADAGPGADELTGSFTILNYGTGEGWCKGNNGSAKGQLLGQWDEMKHVYPPAPPCEGWFC